MIRLGMKRASIRWLLIAGLAAFTPLFYFLAVVGGFLPYLGILVIGIRNLSDSSLLLFSFIHLTLYGVVLYVLAGLITRLIIKLSGGYVWVATAVGLLLLAGIGLIPMFGIAHGQIHWMNAYELYASGTLR